MTRDELLIGYLQVALDDIKLLEAAIRRAIAAEPPGLPEREEDMRSLAEHIHHGIWRADRLTQFGSKNQPKNGEG